jgi:predicted RNA-binding protein
MCLATVHVERNGEKEEVMRDVAWIEFEQEGIRLVTLMGEQKLLQYSIKSIDLVNGAVVFTESGRIEEK